MIDKLISVGSAVNEKIEPVLTNPTTQKALAAIPIGAGGAGYMDLTQGWLAIVSIIVGIIAGILVIIYNVKRNRLITKELELKDIEIKRKSWEVERLKQGDHEES